MQKKISKIKIIVYGVVGLLASAIIIAAFIYLPDLIRTMHGG